MLPARSARAGHLSGDDRAASSQDDPSTMPAHKRCQRDDDRGRSGQHLTKLHASGGYEAREHPLGHPRSFSD